MHYPILWLVLLVAFAVLEGVTAGLVSLWFCLGSLAALLAAWCKAGLAVQIVLFALVSVAAMALLRPAARRLLQPGVHRTNADRILEQEGVVTQPIDNLAGTGQIKVCGAVWTARSKADAPIPAGTAVKVLAIEGVKAIVIPVQQSQNT